jgi:hypothetical protein
MKPISRRLREVSSGSSIRVLVRVRRRGLTTPQHVA